MRRRHAALAATAILVVAIAACGTTSTPVVHLTDTKTLLADALTRLDAATSYHLVISYTAGQEAFKDDLRIHLPSEAVGTVTDNGATVNVLQTGGKLYVQGQDFISEYGGSYDGRLYGNRWVLTTPSLLRTTVLDLAMLESIPSSILKLDFSGRRIDAVAAATDLTAALTAPYGTIYIAEQSPHAFVKMESAQGFIPVTGISNVTFEILEYDDPVEITVPTDIADPTNPSTLPPQYQLKGSWGFGTCDPSSCGFSGVVVNVGGTYPASSPSTFTFTLSRDKGGTSVVDRCRGRIPTVANGKTARISCTVSSRAWQNYYYNSNNVWGQVTVDNPAYDG